MRGLSDRLFSYRKLGIHVAARGHWGYSHVLGFFWAFNRDLDRIRHGSDYRKKHIVVCGLPRSGTSLLYNMLTATLVGFNFDNWERESAKTIQRYDNHVSKSPLDVLRAEEIKASNVQDKRLFFVVLVRDLRDVITPIHPNVPERYFIGYEGADRRVRALAQL